MQPMSHTGALVVLALFELAGGVGQGTWQRDIDLVARHGRTTAEGRAAWERLSQAGPDALLPLLEGMNTPHNVQANWLRTAFDRIVERELQSGGKRIDADALLGFARSPAKQGRARRLAVDLVDTLRPGTRDQLIAGWLDDPEFRFEAVAQALNAAASALKHKNAPDAEKLFRRAFEFGRDQQQLRDAAAGLAQLGVTVSVARQMGFLTDWYVIGPFDGMGQKGFHVAYPPERKVDLGEDLPGQGRPVRWKRFTVREAGPNTRGGHQALVSLRDKAALGDADDAVGFAYTEFTVPSALDAEFRGAADDNLTVWVNGKRVFGFEEWRNGVRLDRHRFKVALQAGKNSVLVKVCQTPAPNPEPNWEFFLRLVDATGKGIPMKNALP
jgi:hypothetical protein